MGTIFVLPKPTDDVRCMPFQTIVPWIRLHWNNIHDKVECWIVLLLWNQAAIWFASILLCDLKWSDHELRGLIQHFAPKFNFILKMKTMQLNSPPKRALLLWTIHFTSDKKASQQRYSTFSTFSAIRTKSIWVTAST